MNPILTLYLVLPNYPESYRTYWAIGDPEIFCDDDVFVMAEVELDVES